MSTIIIDIPLKGDITIEVEGVKGPKCLAETAALEAALGRTKETQNKKEFYEREVHGNERAIVNQRGR